MRSWKFLLCVFCSSALYFESTLTMTGKLVDVGGYKMHLYRTGKAGAPAVILDVCLGGNTLYWSFVQPEVAKFADVCSYDRAGLGWSEESSLQRTSNNIAEELHALLERSSVKGPYILVGHSSGGINMRLYANMYPDDVYGVILVDASHEDQLERFKEIDEHFPVEEEIKIPTHFPNAIRDRIRVLDSAKAKKAGSGEWECFATSMQQLKDSKNQLTDKPLIVITACKKREDMVQIESQKARMREYDKTWKVFQNDFLKYSMKNKQIFAEKSSHFVIFDQPEIVVEAICSMVDQYRNYST